MATYVVLGSFTEQGLQNVSGSVERAEELRSLLQAVGVGIDQLYWTLGGYDFVAVVQAPDDETLAAGILSFASQGNARTHTLRAFDRETMARIAERMQP